MDKKLNLTILESNLSREKIYPGKEKQKRIRYTICIIMESIERKFHLNPQTYFIAVNILDKVILTNPNIFFSKPNIFLAYSLMFLSSKFEDVDCLEFWEVLEKNRQFTKKDFISMEEIIFNKLDFIIPKITSHSFLVQYLSLIHELKKYKKCVALLRKPRFQKHLPSLNALSVISFVLGKDHKKMKELKKTREIMLSGRQFVK